MPVIDVIRRYVTDELLQRGGMQITDDVALIEDGFLTSLETVDLVVFLEERFGIQVDPEEVNEQDFRDLRSIAALVDRKTAVGSGV